MTIPVTPLHGPGKSLRLGRILDPSTRRAVIIPMDHGVSAGPIAGIAGIYRTIGQVAEGGGTAVVVHKGVVQSLPAGASPGTGLIIHLSASTGLGRTPDAKTLVCTVVEALRLGADAVSVHVNFGAETEKEMLHDLGAVARDCQEWGVPLLVMAYPRGPNIKSQFDVEVVKHAARAASELGADLVKTNYTGSAESFREVVRGCPVPVVIAGGPRMGSDLDVLRMVKDSIDAGGSGVSIGRNVFQHADVAGMTRAVAAVVLRGASAEEARRALGG
ncbi:MAG: fructose-bisphosphate aldolase [Euryarchaeota archaeon]|nr:fructose-bisphosphate aldolase [Euryarchaeota archaeon]